MTHRRWSDFGKQTGSHEPIGKPPRAPELTEGVLQERAERQELQAHRRYLERRSVFRGLILLALVVLVASLLRAGATRVFYPGWWRQW